MTQPDQTTPTALSTVEVADCPQCSWPDLRPGEVMGTYPHTGNCPQCGATLPTISAEALAAIQPRKNTGPITLASLQAASLISQSLPKGQSDG